MLHLHSADVSHHQGDQRSGQRFISCTEFRIVHEGTGSVMTYLKELVNGISKSSGPITGWKDTACNRFVIGDTHYIFNPLDNSFAMSSSTSFI